MTKTDHLSHPSFKQSQNQKSSAPYIFPTPCLDGVLSLGLPPESWIQAHAVSWPTE